MVAGPRRRRPRWPDRCRSRRRSRARRAHEGRSRLRGPPSRSRRPSSGTSRRPPAPPRATADGSPGSPRPARRRPASSSFDDLVGPPADVALPEAHRDPAVEDLHHRHRVDLAAVHAGDRHGAPAADGLDRRPAAPRAGRCANLSVSGRATASGRKPTAPIAALATGDPCASMPTASTVPSAPRPSVRSKIAAGTSSTASRSIVSAPYDAARASRSGTRSTPITRRPAWQRDPGRELTHRARARTPRPSPRRARRRTRRPARPWAGCRTGRASARRARRRGS